MEQFIFKGPDQHVNIHEKGVGWQIFDLLNEQKNKVMQICAETGIKESYGDVLKKAIKTALEMKKRGITSNDVISICSYNNLNSVVPYIASLFLNCKIACLDPSISKEDNVYLVKQVEPKIIFIGQEAENLITNVMSEVNFKAEIVSFGSRSKYERFINFLKANSDEENFKPEVPASLKDTFIILFSSGTTGLPKGICLNHYGIMKQMKYGPAPEITSGMLSFASQYWISTFQFIYMSIQTGIPRIVTPKFDVKKAWETINIFKPAVLYTTPSQALELLKEEEILSGKNVDSILFYIIGGASISSNQLVYIRSKFPKSLVVNTYGLTETCGQLAFQDVVNPEALKTILEKTTSCGALVRNIMYKVVDIDTRELCPLNKKGELYVKSDVFMNGYYKMDSSSAWDDDGWLKTGDVVYIDDDMYIHIVDRVKEMFKCMSWHIVPAKLECVISKHADVVNVVVFGIPHEFDGEHPAAVVTLKKDATVTAEELQKFADEQLDEPQKLRGGVTILQEIPILPTGKFNRKKVKEYILQLKK